MPLAIWQKAKSFRFDLGFLLRAGTPQESLTNSVLDVKVVAHDHGEFWLPVSLVRIKLGPDPRAWGRRFFVGLLDFPEADYQGIKQGKRPELAKVAGGTRIRFEFGHEGWERAGAKTLELTLEELARD